MAAVAAAEEEEEEEEVVVVLAAHLHLFEVPPGELRKNHTSENIDY